MSGFPDVLTKEALCKWFDQHARNPQMEIEARIKNITQMGFEAVLKHMKANKGWSNTPEYHMTLDRMHSSGVRETVDVNTHRSTYLRKNRAGMFEVPATREHEVRFAVSSEHVSPSDDSVIQTWRHKRRICFVHKKMFSFELTQVRQGSSEQDALRAPVVYEIEIEYCGQRLDPAPPAQYLADSLLMKVVRPCLQSPFLSYSRPVIVACPAAGHGYNEANVERW